MEKFTSSKPHFFWSGLYGVLSVSVLIILLWVAMINGPFYGGDRFLTDFYDSHWVSMDMKEKHDCVIGNIDKRDEWFGSELNAFGYKREFVEQQCEQTLRYFFSIEKVVLKLFVLVLLPGFLIFALLSRASRSR
jgi:hypothetical protein